MNLFNKKLLLQRIQSFEFPTGEKRELSNKLLIGWQKSLKDSDLEQTKEKSIQGKFLSTFFESILGYTDVTKGESNWSLIQHPRIENDSKEPDGSLGIFTKDLKLTKAVIELKDARAQLDKKQNRGIEKLTPIEQAYLYATKYDGCNWIIVSNFKEVRLYNKFKTQEYYEKFDVLELTNENEFKRFYYLLCKNNLISNIKESIIDLLIKDSTDNEQDITKKFYNDYKKLRLDLLQHLIINNPKIISKEVLLEKTQKLLDRFVFTMFCEDTSNLLPLNIVKNTYDRAINSLSPSDERVWTEFKGLFLAIDKGNNRVKPPINAYNGGLFSLDDVLDTLVIKDEIWTELMRLANYDFDTDLNVNILGHIFEQSISDLEIIKENIAIGLEQGGVLLTESGGRIIMENTIDKPVEKKGRRKKEGIYYTPEYITRYIVENTVGRYLEEQPTKLDSIKILDPACGSGAFLNQTHSYLLKEHKNRYEARLDEKLKKGENITLFDYNPAEANRGILLNNLYGVDLNQESIEITKLALWLKTARSSEPLQNLDKNIKCGNSLIDDSAIAGAKAFKWDNEFKDIISNGGFDVIVGNPPYGYRGIPSKELKEYYKNTFETYEGNFEFYRFFIEKSMRLLKSGGYLSFIIPNTFLTSKTYSKLREFLLKYCVVEIIELGLDVFADVLVESTILIIKKQSPTENLIYVGIDKTHPNFINCDTHYKVHQDDWINNLDKTFTVYIDPKSENIIKKMNSSGVKLGNIAICTVGINTGNIKSEMTSRERKDDRYHKTLNGKNIGRYTVDWQGEWIIYDKSFVQSFGDQGRSLPPEEIFSSPKILLQRTRRGMKKKLVGYYDTEGYYNFNRISNIVITDKSFLTGYIAGLVNSTLMDFFFNKKFVEYEVKPFHLSQLPIVKVDMKTQEKVSDMVEQIQVLYKDVGEMLRGMSEFIISEFKFVGKLSDKYLEGWNQLTGFLDKKLVKLDINKKEELFTWFKSKKNELQKLQNEINTIDFQIDREVYKLYNLTEEEVKIIEDSLK